MSYVGSSGKKKRIEKRQRRRRDLNQLAPSSDSRSEQNPISFDRYSLGAHPFDTKIGHLGVDYVRDKYAVRQPLNANRAEPSPRTEAFYTENTSPDHVKYAIRDKYAVDEKSQVASVSSTEEPTNDAIEADDVAVSEISARWQASWNDTYYKVLSPRNEEAIQNVQHFVGQQSLGRDRNFPSSSIFANHKYSRFRFEEEDDDFGSSDWVERSVVLGRQRSPNPFPRKEKNAILASPIFYHHGYAPSSFPEESPAHESKCSSMDSAVEDITDLTTLSSTTVDVECQGQTINIADYETKERSELKVVSNTIPEEIERIENRTPMSSTSTGDSSIFPEVKANLEDIAYHLERHRQRFSPKSPKKVADSFDALQASQEVIGRSDIVHLSHEASPPNKSHSSLDAPYDERTPRSQMFVVTYEDDVDIYADALLDALLQSPRRLPLTAFREEETDDDGSQNSNLPTGETTQEKLESSSGESPLSPPALETNKNGDIIIDINQKSLQSAHATKQAKDPLDLSVLTDEVSANLRVEPGSPECMHSPSRPLNTKNDTEANGKCSKGLSSSSPAKHSYASDKIIGPRDPCILADEISSTPRWSPNSPATSLPASFKFKTSTLRVTLANDKDLKSFQSCPEGKEAHAYNASAETRDKVDANTLPNEIVFICPGHHSLSLSDNKEEQYASANDDSSTGDKATPTTSDSTPAHLSPDGIPLSTKTHHVIAANTGSERLLCSGLLDAEHTENIVKADSDDCRNKAVSKSPSNSSSCTTASKDIERGSMQNAPIPTEAESNMETKTPALPSETDDYADDSVFTDDYDSFLDSASHYSLGIDSQMSQSDWGDVDFEDMTSDLLLYLQEQGSGNQHCHDVSPRVADDNQDSIQIGSENVDSTTERKADIAESPACNLSDRLKEASSTKNTAIDSTAPEDQEEGVLSQPTCAAHIQENKGDSNVGPHAQSHEKLTSDVEASVQPDSTSNNDENGTTPAELDRRDTVEKNSCDGQAEVLSTPQKEQHEENEVLSPGMAIPSHPAYAKWRAMGLMSDEKKKKSTPTKPTTPKRQHTRRVSFSADTPIKERKPVVMKLRKDWRRPPSNHSFRGELLTHHDSISKKQSHLKIDTHEFSSLLSEWKKTAKGSKYEILNGGVLSPFRECKQKRKYRSSWPKKDTSYEEVYFTDTNFCPCSMPFFSGNDDMIDFFLPKVGMSCTCGKQSTENYFDPLDPTSLENILRPWQVDFLQSFGMRRGDEFVKAHHRYAGVLAKCMVKWRDKHDMIPVRTVSCGMALHIWSRTCKIHVRSIRKQQRQKVEEIKPPSALEVLSVFMERVSIPQEKLLSPPVKGNGAVEDSQVEV